MSLPPFLDHTARGALFGAFFGGSVAAVGWAIRQRNEAVIDLGVPAPHLLAHHRDLAETILHFKAASEHSDATRALFAQIVKDCEYVVEHRHAPRGVAQVVVQKCITDAVHCARRLAREALRHRDPTAYEIRTQIDTLQGHLGGIQKNMLMGT